MNREKSRHKDNLEVILGLKAVTLLRNLIKHKASIGTFSSYIEEADCLNYYGQGEDSALRQDSAFSVVGICSNGMRVLKITASIS